MSFNCTILAIVVAKTSSGHFSALAAVVTKPVPSALVNTNMSPGCAVIGKQVRRFHHSGHREPILDFRVANRVASHNHGPDFQDPLRTAREYRMQDFQFELIVGEPDDIHGCDRVRSHRQGVAQRIGRGNLSEDVRVVNQGRKKIDRFTMYRSSRSRYTPASLNAELGANNQIRIFKPW